MNVKSNNPQKKSEVDPSELASPDVLTILQILKNVLIKLKDKTAIILYSSFLLLIFWGAEGDLKIFNKIFGDKWPEAIFPNVSWRNQLVSFIIGFILLVVVPCCIIKFGFKEKLSEYGLGWPKEGRKLGVLVFFVLLVIMIIPYYIGTLDADMRLEYPLFGDAIAKGDWGAFIIFELVYLLFFIVIEFIFRGYLLFGLYKIKDIEAIKGVKGFKGPLVFGLYAILIQMLSYTMWHITKPVPELLGTIVWGILVGAVALKIRSIWPIILVHWILNIFTDVIHWLR